MERLFDLDDGASRSPGARPTTRATTSAAASGARSLSRGQPLAARMRPRSLDEYVGQADVIGHGTALRSLLEKGELPSLILWGPPGSGKTSLASVIAEQVSAAWVELSAVTAGVKDVRKVIEQAQERQRSAGRPTVLFLGEIHRFNTSQQDALLPVVEDGTLLLVGATTQNPFFALNAPLLSRCTLLQLTALDADDVRTIVHRALEDTARGVGVPVELSDDAERYLVASADGDARTALNTLEVAVAATEPDDDGTVRLGADDVRSSLRHLRFDRTGDEHYDQISAFIKSMRGSDPDAAVYWLLRMLEAGEDPRFLTRRMVIFASEDVGMTDRGALTLATSAADAVDRVGLPEARYALVHAAIGLAVAPKSNSVARALSAGTAAVRDAGNAGVPVHLRDAHYAGAAELGHGKGYRYPHDDPRGFVEQRHLPDELVGHRLYEPSEHGEEAAVARRVAELRGSRGAGAERERRALTGVTRPGVQPDTDTYDTGRDT